MNEDDYLAALLRPEDDRAWKLAVGKSQQELVAQTRRTNGRVDVHGERLTALEAWQGRVGFAQGTPPGQPSSAAATQPAALTVSFNRAQLLGVGTALLGVLAAGIWRIVEVGL